MFRHFAHRYRLAFINCIFSNLLFGFHLPLFKINKCLFAKYVPYLMFGIFQVFGSPFHKLHLCFFDCLTTYSCRICLSSFSCHFRTCSCVSWLPVLLLHRKFVVLFAEVRFPAIFSPAPAFLELPALLPHQKFAV